MHNNEWSLIFFTLISQLSVGILLMFSFLHFVYPNTVNSLSVWWKSPEIVILVLLGIGSIISLLHLGNPLNAPNSINNLMGSWISKEILGLGLLVGSVFVLFLVRWIFESPIWLLNLMVIISSLTGIFFIYSMSRIYAIATIPSWDTWFTPVSFFFSVILFGLISVILMNVIGNGMLSNLVQIKQIILILLIFIIIQLVATILHQFKLSGFESAGIEGISFSKGMYFSMFIVRTALLFILGIVCLFIYINSPHIELNSLFGLILLLALISQEFIGRMMFYQSYFRIGV